MFWQSVRLPFLVRGYNLITYRILRTSHTNLTLILSQAIVVCSLRWGKMLNGHAFKDVREVETVRDNTRNGLI